MEDDPNACFSPDFISELEVAVLALPVDHRRITWANSEKGLVAALVGPPRDSFVVGIEEGLVLLIDKQAGRKLEAGSVGHVTGETVARLMQDVLAARSSMPDGMV